ncbi:hypothetical protein SSSV7_gp10 [Sulfolobus spindle-shaped virus 7]|uniref:Uncharacterized protein n=1 Tax=Sulfolobus spindle-shaped virus 7 TaxID=693628 RepID=D1GF61_9VIRU|nr:hypothetical protein SSSV7_gp10 [Sulfolobus spindle-shaped virus 7]ACZ35763.1 hypothetical protein [Sulfolobus spindle-shaped virus 7]
MGIKTRSNYFFNQTSPRKGVCFEREIRNSEGSRRWENVKEMKFNFQEIDERQPTLIVKLAPTSEDGSYGEAIVQFKRLLELREIKATTKDGKQFTATRYEMVAIPIEGMFADIVNKEEVPKKDPKTGRIVGKDLIPKVYDADELAKIMRERGNDGVIIRLSPGSYELIRRNVNAGKIKEGDIIKLEYTIGANGGAFVRKLYKSS